VGARDNPTDPSIETEDGAEGIPSTPEELVFTPEMDLVAVAVEVELEVEAKLKAEVVAEAAEIDGLLRKIANVRENLRHCHCPSTDPKARSGGKKRRGRDHGKGRAKKGMGKSVNSLGRWRDCLNAVRRVLRTYAAVRDYYGWEDSSAFDPRASASLVVFEVVQQAVQSGPLSGSKPGYFRRASPETAQEAVEFLKEVAGVLKLDGSGGYRGRTGIKEDGEDNELRVGLDEAPMYFSGRQCMAIFSWIDAGLKALDKFKSPEEGM